MYHSKPGTAELTIATGHHPDTRRPGEFHGTSRAATITAWTLQVILGFAMVGGGILKLSGDPAMVNMFNDIGVGQWFRFVVGLVEVLGGVGLVIPRFRALAALCLLALLTCATVTNVAVLETNTLASIVLGTIALAILVIRRHELFQVKRLRTLSKN